MFLLSGSYAFQSMPFVFRASFITSPALSFLRQGHCILVSCTIHHHQHKDRTMDCGAHGGGGGASGGTCPPKYF